MASYLDTFVGRAAVLNDRPVSVQRAWAVEGDGVHADVVFTDPSGGVMKDILWTSLSTVEQITSTN